MSIDMVKMRMKLDERDAEIDRLRRDNERLRAALEPARTAFKNLSDYMQSQETRSGKFRTLWDDLALALEHPATAQRAWFGKACNLVNEQTP